MSFVIYGHLKKLYSKTTGISKLYCKCWYNNLMKGLAIWVLVIAVLGIGGFTLLSRQKTNVSPVDATSQATQESSQSKSESKYIEYSSGILERNVESNRILFFYANWCSTCRPADKEIGENENKIPNGYVVIRVNYNDTDTDNEEETLANKYKVTYQHTFVEIDKNGEVIQSWNGVGLDMLLGKIAR